MTVISMRRTFARLATALTVATGLAFVSHAALAQQGLPVIQFPPPGAGIGLPGLSSSNGSMVFYGNYCGPGSRGAGRPPIDALDAACMRHDACSPPAGTALTYCGCNARLVREAQQVFRSRRISDETRAAAGFIAESIRALPCR